MTEFVATGPVDPDEGRDPALAGGPALPAYQAPDDDAEFADLPPKRHVPALTKLLVVGILVGISFAGGVLVQKQHDAGQTSSVPNFAGGAGGLPGFNAGGGAAGGAPSTGGGAPVAASGPVLVGTVESISSSDITIKDLGGTTHVVHTSATTGLSTTGADWSTSLLPGSIVSIDGTKADDGTVSATTITRSADAVPRVAAPLPELIATPGDPNDDLPTPSLPCAPAHGSGARRRLRAE